ncbi:phospho-N-acetylmuramoyl-pentapeptide-transferase [Parabacteroides sp. PF5-5]|uniref:phospho-N-acetylmuramoyl-pentapeptide- transferase n=1 Tax=unclassified Parabacteroides TaxID=2649774 RepID=UPI002472FBD0|nr:MULTISPECIES: phospho-N-acetylmuramoyl-pentapeptide-transferase [unclassified Parabacteroides]MDH6303376.1 phospho-N-acetylmuramoyl-pentapeptide-transferase [Parabacteroides sp. PH5-39]MDH6314699.1 phospho-N-acetylmuramoyl-pentapeptide-transferase [Parabacteroides sp. PF5-13]MDH6318036.1 phospho-N-acetylmuramoyl-pentapeptide-transferase [Parabacteroides sp. PH5-13]MDH6322033.1 phospho-N-acetylmuramoyl-pentapeptide-transferase [Parabacteroides sp. PH5-8]MDH6326156.1 phospho-N-acetylmuramoyl-
MLYYLFTYLDQLDFPGAGMFKYVSFRSGLALILSLFISTTIGRRIINWLQRLQIGETVRDLGLEGQMSKKGTPTMGGLIIIVAILIPVLLCARLDNIYVILMIVTTIWLGLIGFTDDYIKVFRKNKEGLHGRSKIVGQVGLGLIVGLVLYMSPDVVIRENVEVLNNENVVESVHFHSLETKSTKTTIPFLKNNNFDYASLASWAGEYKTEVSWIIFVLVVIFIVTAVSNGANLTDGLDGLATGSSAIIGVALGILAYMSSHAEFASFLNIMFIPGAQELVIFASAFIGATIGFLWYNAYPAQVFMGDTGSLTLGGIIAVFAVIIRKELLIPILCGIFLAESVSVMAQVFYFKYTKKRYGEGKRIFKMTPLHHHFQKPGHAGIDAMIQKPYNIVPESKIVVRFWLIGIILAAITIVTLKMR